MRKPVINTRWRLAACAAALGAVSIAASTNGAEPAPGAAPAPNPPAAKPQVFDVPQDVTGKPLSQAPKIVFDNDLVRVKDVVMMPGETNTLHLHDLDHLGIIIDGGKMAVRSATGKVGGVTSTRGSVGFVKAGTKHEAINVGSEPVRFIIVELKN